MTTSRSSKHPALTMSKRRADVWLKYAKPNNYFKFVDSLRVLYARQHYKAGETPMDEDKLFNDFLKWKEEGRKNEW